MVPKKQLSSIHQQHLQRLIKELTRVDMFSTPTMTITMGNTQAGTDEGRLDQPHPFHPINANTLKLMMAEQHN